VKIILVTCQAYPSLSRSDKLLADRLEALEHEVCALPWNDTSNHSAFVEADGVVLRSNWDYHQDLPAFVKWLDRLDAAECCVMNPVSLIKWNLDKRYLIEIASAGISVPKTELVAEETADGIARQLRNRGADGAVLKPAWGASGVGVELVEPGNEKDAVSRVRRSAPGRPLLLQEYIPEIADGEYSLVYFRGRFSHAFLKTPERQDFRVNSQYGGKNAAVHIDEQMRSAGEFILTKIPLPSVYARVDMVKRGTDFVLMEIELSEPALGLQFSTSAADSFAKAILAELSKG